MRKLFIQFSVTDGQYPVGIFGIGKAVCDKNDGFAAFVAGEKQFHYFLSGAAVKISARLVRKDKVGSAAIALAIATRCCCPPESSYGLCDSLAESPTASSAEVSVQGVSLSGYLCK